MYVKRALEKSGGNVTRAAEIAGTNRRMIQRIVARLGVDPKTVVDDDPEK